MDDKNTNLAKMILIRLIFLIIIAFIASCVTMYFIKQNDANKEEKVVIQENKIQTNQVVEPKSTSETEETINLNDTFDLNDLRISLLKEKYLGVEIEYFKIDGLKDQNIQKEINYTLKNDIKDFVEKAKDEDKIAQENFYIYAYINSSFANTLSLTYYVSSYILQTNEDGSVKKQEELLNEYIPENFDLTTGEKITVNDLFTQDFKAQNFINHDFYTQLVSSNVEIGAISEEDWNLHIQNYNDLEDTMLEFVTLFNNKKDMKFSFNEQKVTFLDYGVNVYYEDYLDYITIYNKYSIEESIFDGRYEYLNDLPVLTKRYYADYSVMEQAENYYIDISLFDVYIEDSEYRNETIFEDSKKYVDNVVEEIKEKARKNPSKFYVFNYAYNLGTVDNPEIEDYTPYDNILRLDESRIEYETTEEEFTSRILYKIRKMFRNAQRMETGEAYCYDNLFLYYTEIVDDPDNIEISDSVTIYLNSQGEMFDNEFDALNS